MLVKTANNLSQHKSHIKKTGADNTGIVRNTIQYNTILRKADPNLYLYSDVLKINDDS